MTKSSEPIEIVRQFCDAWSKMNFDAIMAALAEDIHYHNVPLQPVTGKANVERYLKQAWRFDRCDWVLLNIAANGKTVLTERIDKFWFGDNEVALPVMGVFIIEGDQIRLWRDYFDLADYRKQLAAAQKEA